MRSAPSGHTGHRGGCRSQASVPGRCGSGQHRHGSTRQEPEGEGPGLGRAGEGRDTHPSTKTRPAAAPSPTGKVHSTASSMATGATEKPKKPSSEQMAASAAVCPRSWDTWAVSAGDGVRQPTAPRWRRRARQDPSPRDRSAPATGPGAPEVCTAGLPAAPAEAPRPTPAARSWL